MWSFFPVQTSPPFTSGEGGVSGIFCIFLSSLPFLVEKIIPLYFTILTSSSCFLPLSSLWGDVRELPRLVPTFRAFFYVFTFPFYPHLLSLSLSQVGVFWFFPLSFPFAILFRPRFLRSYFSPGVFPPVLVFCSGLPVSIVLS